MRRLATAAAGGTSHKIGPIKIAAKLFPVAVFKLFKVPAVHTPIGPDLSGHAATLAANGGSRTFSIAGSYTFQVAALALS